MILFLPLCPTKTKLVKKRRQDWTLPGHGAVQPHCHKWETDQVWGYCRTCGSSTVCWWEYSTFYIINQISCHKKSLAATLLVGIARKHRARMNNFMRALLSQPCPMESEVAFLDTHYKDTVQNIQKLVPKFQIIQGLWYSFSVVACHSGTTLHIRQLTLFGMITRLKDCAVYVHSFKSQVKSLVTT